MVKVSVVIPTYNAGPYVWQAVESVLAQTYPNVECIVVDDGSTDNTDTRLAPYIDQIVYVHQENKGRSAARNAGLRQADGDYIALLDADDYWAPEKLARQAALMKSNEGLGFVACWAYAVTVDGKAVRLLRTNDDGCLAPGLEGFARLVTLEFGLPAPLSTLLIRRSCLEEVGLFDESINTAEEWDLLLRAIPRWGIGCVGDALAFNRRYGYLTPNKVAPRRRPDKYIEVVTRAFERLPDRMRYAVLGRRALALAYLRGALYDYATEKTSSAQDRITRAWEYYSDLFLGAQSEYQRTLADFAITLYDTVTPLEVALQFVRQVYDHLPRRLADLEASRRQTLALVCAAHAFDGHQRGDVLAVRQGVWRALYYDRKWLRNRGLFSILAQSWLGSQTTTCLRHLRDRAVHELRPR